MVFDSPFSAIFDFPDRLLVASFINYAVKTLYALCAATETRFDTVGVWGSNPHAPTIFLRLFRCFCPPLIGAGTIWQTLIVATLISDQTRPSAAMLGLLIDQALDQVTLRGLLGRAPSQIGTAFGGL